MIAPCPDCGSSIDGRGLSQHRRGAACLVAGNVRDARRRGLTPAAPHHRMLGALGVVERIASRLIPGGPRKRTKVEAQPWAPASLVSFADSLAVARMALALRRVALAGAVEAWQAASLEERLRRDQVALDLGPPGHPQVIHEAPSGALYTLPETTLPEDTLRAAGISDARQAAYQRRMSEMLAGRG